MHRPFRPSALAVAAALVLGGCIVAPAEKSPDELAERYAREETRLIDEQAFEQARERARVQRSARRREAIESAAPRAIDPQVRDGWQFGLFVHPVDGQPTCAALSGIGVPPPAAGAAAPRLVMVADGGWIVSEAPLASDRPESAVRVDGGLPIPLEVAEDGRQARLALPAEALFARLRAGAVATVDVAVRVAAVGGAPEAAAGASAEASGDGAADDVPLERTIELDALGPMLDEIERCAGAASGLG